MVSIVKHIWRKGEDGGWVFIHVSLFLAHHVASVARRYENGEPPVFTLVSVETHRARFHGRHGDPSVLAFNGTQRIEHALASPHGPAGSEDNGMVPDSAGEVSLIGHFVPVFGFITFFL